MKLDASEPSRDAFAAPVPSGDALLPGLDPLFERLEQHARAAHGAFADNTVRALAADRRIFAAWCREAGRVTLPATPETVAAFIDAQAETKARATVERYRSSIAALHRAAGLPNPCADEIVRLAVKRMNRTKGRHQKQAEPLDRTSIERMLEVKTPGRLHRRLTEAKRETPQIALRRGARRGRLRHAAAPLRTRLVVYGGSAQGLRWLRIRAGAALEGRPGGGGAIKYLAPATMAPIAAWLAAAQLESGPLFRPLTKGGQVGEDALGGGEVSRVFRDLATASGLKLARLPCGHSTRVGATQDMFAAGFELLEVMQAGSWKTPAMPARYGERLRAQRGAARTLATLPNRA